MAYSIRQSYYWQTVWEDCEEYSQKCPKCQAFGKSFKETLEPWSKVELAVHGPFPSSTHLPKYMITIQDVFSKYLVAKQANVSTAEALSKICAEFAFSTFCAHEFKRCFFVTYDDCLFQHFLFNSIKLWQQIKDEKFSVDEAFERLDTPRNMNLVHEMADLVTSNPDWDVSLDALMYMYRKRPVSGKAPINLTFSDKETPKSVTTKSGRQSRKMTMVCDHCGEIFTSRVSFKMHSSRHSREKPEIQQPHLAISKVKEPSSKNILENPEPDRVKELTESTVATVKALLVATTDERRKRGKYFKYDQKLKESISDYAELHGIANASKHFSELLQLPVSESTVRNFVYSSLSFLSNEEQTKIGKFACEYGIDACLKDFSSNPALTRPMVTRLKRIYRQSSKTSSIEEVKNIDGNKKRSFDAGLKDDIGRHAFHFGNINAVNHFSEKLQFQVKESTVRKFKKNWVEKNTPNQLASGSNQYLNLSHNSMDCAQQNVTTFDHGGSTVVANENLQHSHGEGYIHMSNYDISQPIPLTVSNSMSSLQVKVSKETPSSTKKTKSGRKVVKKKPVKSKVMSRGHYTNYDEGLRCEIASYALDHGNLETINFFRKHKGIQLPESTVRSLRSRLQRQQEESGESSSELLGKRGRPIRLGAYDSIVKDCIIKLSASGERVSSFVVIATAKQILSQNAPEVLAENGGDVELTPGWARSFLRRAGIKSKE